MFTTKKGILYVTSGIIALVLIVNLSLGAYLSSRNQTSTIVNSHKVVTEKEQAASSKKDSFVYNGVEGKNVLEILQSKTTVKQNSSGLVVSINGRQADDKKQEFWALYVNGEIAEVGPATYQTKDEDRIEWKIGKY